MNSPPERIGPDREIEPPKSVESEPSQLPICSTYRRSTSGLQRPKEVTK
jgi:hypothetical protein